MLTLASTPSPAEFATSETIDGQSIIVNMHSSTWIALNATGSYLWQRLDGRTTLASIAAALAESYQIEPEVTAADVLALAAELAQEGMIVVASD